MKTILLSIFPIGRVCAMATEVCANQARLCDPDTLTHRYLAVLTGEKDRHDYSWWKSWWDKHQAKLEWKPESGTFAVPN